MVTAVVAAVLLAGCIGCDPARPARALVGAPPSALDASVVQIRSGSGSMLRAWFSKGREGYGAVLLLHGVGDNRTSMLGRARFLHAAGYSVLAPDFQAHGESEGKHITFGARESLDAAAAVRFLRAAVPGERVGVIGVSLGGAATLLGNEPLGADALVLESVYPTIEDAVTDRLRVWLGPLGFLGHALMPSVIEMIGRETGVKGDQLRPIEHVRQTTSPILFLTGSMDRYTPLSEARALFQRARAPKQFWIVEGAGHEDLHAFAPAAYEDLVQAFFGMWLHPTSVPHVTSGQASEASDIRCGHVVLLRHDDAANQRQAGHQFRTDQGACD
ncbi:MAG: alpha/beta hydrolase [Gemmatimonadaceae bacterium]